MQRRLDTLAAEREERHETMSDLVHRFVWGLLGIAAATPIVILVIAVFRSMGEGKYLKPAKLFDWLPDLLQYLF